VTKVEVNYHLWGVLIIWYKTASFGFFMAPESFEHPRCKRSWYRKWNQWLKN